MVARVWFGVLGPIEARAGASPLALGPPQQRTVLAALLLNAGAVTSTDQLTEALWEDRPPAGAVKTVRTYVSRLRAALGPAGDTIESRARGYLLHTAPDGFDLARFRELTSLAPPAAGERADRARQALELFRGEPLAGLPGSWAETQRDRLARLRATAYESLFTAELEAGRHAEIIAEMTAAVGEFPFHERLRELQMSALYRTGLRAEAFTAYRAVQRLLDLELGVEPMPALQDLHRRMLQGDPALLAPSGPAPGIAPPRLAPEKPAQLIAAPTVFTGRDQELHRAAELREASGAGPAVIVISGMGGVGKTSLALHWAHRLTPRYGDGQLYADLRGYGPDRRPMAPDDVLSGFLYALGMAPADVPDGLKPRAALFRTLIAGRTMLILLDNAATADQVIDLLPGTGRSLVIVTSRGTLPDLLTRTAAPVLALQPPGHDEALALFTARTGAHRVRAEPAAAHDIVELGGRLPLALAIAAARAVTSAHLPLSALADDLRAAHGTLTAFRLPHADHDVAAVLSWSYQALENAAAEAFRRLALHPGPDLSAEAAAGMLALSLPETRDVLAELVAAALLTEHAPGRWVFHDLVRAYGHHLARQRDDDDTRRATVHRLLDHYLYAAGKANLRLFRRELPVAPERPAPGVTVTDIDTDIEANAWFADEHLAALAATDLAAREHLDTHTWLLAWTLRDYLNRQGLWHHQQTSQRVALAAALRDGRPVAEAHTRFGLAGAELHMVRYPEVHSHLRRALAIFERIGDRENTERTVVFIAAVLGRQGEWPAALERYETLLAAHPPHGDPLARARILMEAAWARTQLGRYAEAAADAREVIRTASQLSPLRLADTWDTLGYALAGLGDLDEAADSYHQAVDLYRRHGAPVWAAESLRRLGDILHGAGRDADAEKAHRQALVLVATADGPQAVRLRTDLERILSTPAGA